MVYLKHLFLLLFLLHCSALSAAPIQIMLSINNNQLEQAHAIIDEVHKVINSSDKFWVMVELVMGNDDTLGKSLEVAQQLGISHILVFDFTRHQDNLQVIARLADTSRIDVLKTFSFKSSLSDAPQITRLFTQARILPFMDDKLLESAKLEIMGEISLVSPTGMVYLRMENDLSPPPGSNVTVYNHYMSRVGNVMVTQIEDQTCLGVITDQSEEHPIEKGDIVKLALGNEKGTDNSQLHEKYLICVNCNGQAQQKCQVCEQGLLLHRGIKTICPECSGSGFTNCNFCNGLGFLPQL